MSASITLATPRLDLIPSHSDHTLENLNEYDNFKKGQRTEPTKPTEPTKVKTNLSKAIASYTPEEAELHTTLQSYGIVVPLVVLYIQKYNLNQIYEKIFEAKKRCSNINKLGAYIRSSLENIPTDLTKAATGGNINKIDTADLIMGKPAAPAPNEAATWPKLIQVEQNYTQAKKPESKAARTKAMSLIWQKLKKKNPND